MAASAVAMAKDRDAMILSQEDHVRAIARHIYWKYGQRTPLDDLIQVGYLGLIAAVDNYDGSVPLGGYAHHRIRGAMLDFLEVDLNRGLRHCDPAAEVKPTLVDLDDVANASVPARTVDAMALRRLQAARAKLTPRLQLIVSEYYEKERTNSDIGLSLGVGGTRVHQLHRGALKKLRNMMSEQEPR